MRIPLVAALLVLALALLAAPMPALAQDLPQDHVYIVEHGDSLSSIAQHLGCTSHALAERNHLDPPYVLRPGRRLRLPEGVDPAVARRLPLRDGLVPSGSRTASLASVRGGRSWGRPHHPGTVDMIREWNNETLTLNLRRRPTRTTLRRMEHFLRFGDGRQHDIQPRLLRQLAIVSDHFGGRRIHVISGFRPYRRGQWTAHSNHNIGAAIDFRVEGVPNRTLRDYCRTFPQTGCGYYPRSVFVHMDVREESATWVDWSRPGQRPIYGREDRPPGEVNVHAPSQPAPPADESMDDVADDAPPVRNAVPDPEDNDAPTSAAGTTTASATANSGATADPPPATAASPAPAAQQ